MKAEKYLTDFLRIFDKAFINEHQELVVCPKTNLYFRIDNVNSKEDFIYKIFAWCSRDASKSEPFGRNKKMNEAYRATLRNGLNEFLCLEWDEGQWLDIYSDYGNGIHEEECRKFIRYLFGDNL